MNIEVFRKIYADWHQSGQSVRAYTRSIGIKEDKFYYWQKRLKDMEKNKVVKSGSFIKMPLLIVILVKDKALPWQQKRRLCVSLYIPMA